MAERATAEPVLIVGGGLSGLSLGVELRARGVPVTVLEAQDRPGGALRTRAEAGFLTEDAANSYLDREPATRALIEQVGLSGAVRHADPRARSRFIFTAGALRALPHSPPALLASRIVPWSTKLRMLGEVLSRRGSDEDESLARFFRRHLGAHATEVLVDAMQTGTYAGDPERLSARATFPKLVELERTHRSLLLGSLREQRARKRNPQPLAGPPCTFARGMGMLPEALAEKLGSALQLSCPVTALRRDAGGWAVDIKSGTTLSAARLVLALPSDPAGRLLGAVDGALATDLRGIAYAPVGVVHLGFESTTLATVPSGFGLLVPAVEGLPVLGIIFASSLFPFRAPDGQTLLSCILGGARHPELMETSDGHLVALAREGVARTLKIQARPTLQSVVRWPAGIPQYEVGHLARLARMETRLAALPGLSLLGNAYRGVGVNDCVREAAALALNLTA